MHIYTCTCIWRPFPVTCTGGAEGSQLFVGRALRGRGKAGSFLECADWDWKCDIIWLSNWIVHTCHNYVSTVIETHNLPLSPWY